MVAISYRYLSEAAFAGHADQIDFEQRCNMRRIKTGSFLEGVVLAFGEQRYQAQQAPLIWRRHDEEATRLCQPMHRWL